MAASHGGIPRQNASLGYAAQDIIGRSLLELIPHTKRSAAEDIITRVGDGATYAQFETVRVHNDGKVVDVELTVAPLRDRNGSIVGGVTFCRDIRERKRVEDSLARTV